MFIILIWSSKPFNIARLSDNEKQSNDPMIFEVKNSYDSVYIKHTFFFYHVMFYA